MDDNENKEGYIFDNFFILTGNGEEKDENDERGMIDNGLQAQAY